MAFGKAKSKANLERIQMNKRRHIQECKRSRANHLKNQEKNKYKTPPNFHLVVKSSKTNIIAQALCRSIDGGYSIYAAAHYHDLEYCGVRIGLTSAAAYCIGRIVAFRASSKFEMDDVDVAYKDGGIVEVFLPTADVFYVDPPEAIDAFMATAEVFYVAPPDSVDAAPITGNLVVDAVLEGALDGGLFNLGSSKDSKQLDAEVYCKKVHAAVRADPTIKQPPNEVNRQQHDAEVHRKKALAPIRFNSTMKKPEKQPPKELNRTKQLDAEVHRKKVHAVIRADCTIKQPEKQPPKELDRSNLKKLTY